MLKQFTNKLTTKLTCSPTRLLANRTFLRTMSDNVFSAGAARLAGKTVFITGASCKHLLPIHQLSHGLAMSGSWVHTVTLKRCVVFRCSRDWALDGTQVRPGWGQPDPNRSARGAAD